MKNLNILAVSILVISLFSCNSTPTRDSLIKEISKYKEESTQINTTIDSLEKIINADSSIVTTTFGEPVIVKTIKPEIFTHYFEATGNIEAVNSAFISPEMNGQITKIFVEEGQHVKKGQILATLNTKIIRKNMDEVKTGLDLATKMYEKQKELWDKNIGSEIQYLQAKNGKESLENKLEVIKAQLEMAEITAPFDGIVDEIFKKTGEIASPGMQFIQFVNLSKIEITANVSEEYISKLKVGENIDLSFPSYPKLTMKTKIYRIGNVINPANRTFEIQLRINNKNEMLKPNMTANIKIADFSADSAFVVPSIIIKDNINGKFIYIAKKDNNNKTIAQKVLIETGRSYNENTMITKGLHMNDMVIVKGYNMITNKTTLKVLN